MLEFSSVIVGFLYKDSNNEAAKKLDSCPEEVYCLEALLLSRLPCPEFARDEGSERGAYMLLVMERASSR